MDQSKELPYWSRHVDDLLSSLDSAPEGISNEEAAERLRKFGLNTLKATEQRDGMLLFLRQFANPITLILIAAAILSFFLGQRTDSLIIIFIIFISAFLGFIQEKGAANALSHLMKLVQVNCTVLRDGKEEDIPMQQTVPGDIVLLNAGDTVPGDCRMLESRDLYANEAALTGETFPAEKKCSELPANATLAEKCNTLFMGTHVVSGTAKAVVVNTGTATEFGAISQRLRHPQPETEFEKGIHRFGFLLMELTLLLVVIIFSINISLHKPLLDSFLFSLAIAVGLTPQLLPAIISINLARGASQMAKENVIVKKLSAIENFGSMDVLCSDKTGTITEGRVVLEKTLDYLGNENEKVFRLAYLNAFFESGFTNPIDEAIRNFGKPDIGGIVKKDELPYDFIRKRLSIMVSEGRENTIITKGAFDRILEVCSHVEDGSGKLVPLPDVEDVLRGHFTELSQEGYRVLGIACKKATDISKGLSKDDETEMVFMGMLLFTDPPKKDVKATLQDLKALGITLKIITGDNALVAAHVSRQVGLENPVLITGAEIREMSSEALVLQAYKADVFAAVEPNQKERILMALRKAGSTVGFIGDGINDAPALHAADVGISVSTAVDVAKEAADIVLLGNDLRVLINGVREGRKTFANTLKYIFMATSANFGNMFSMAGLSLFLPFLPLLPKQVLLTNLLTDIPEMTIATDKVDLEMIAKPRKMNIGFIRKFMIVFGLASSIFDYLTFGVLLYILKAGPDEFRTGWLVESVISASLIVLVIRSSQPFYRSRPGKWLLVATFLMIAITLLLPYSPIAIKMGMVPLPARFYPWLGGIIIFYIATAELLKKIFYKMLKQG